MVLVSYAAGSPMCTLLVFVSLCSCCASDAQPPLVIDISCNGLLAFASALEVEEKSHVNKLAEWHQSFTCYNQLFWSFKNDYLQAIYRINGTRCLIIFFKHWTPEFKVKPAGPLRGEPVCLSLTSFFLFFLLPHVVSLPLSALRLWWVKEKWDFSCCVSPFVWWALFQTLYWSWL